MNLKELLVKVFRRKSKPDVNLTASGKVDVRNATSTSCSGGGK